MKYNRSLPAIAMIFSLWAHHAHAETARPFDQSLYERPGQEVDIGAGRHLNLVCQGSGSPAVLLEAGFGESSVTWRDVMPAIAKITRTCAYDRAGLGFSDPAQEPQDAAHMADLLHKLVETADIGEPFVLVAHSMGGLIAVRYADTHLDDLAGMVLVDPGVAHQNKLLSEVSLAYHNSNTGQRTMILTCRTAAVDGAIKANNAKQEECSNVTPGADATLAASEKERAAKISYWDALLSQHENMFSQDPQQITVNSRQLDDSKRDYGDLPLIVLTAGSADFGLDGDEKKQMNALWMKLHDNLAARSSAGVNRLVADAGHYIQNDEPQIVIDAITEVVARARQHSPH